MKKIAFALAALAAAGVAGSANAADLAAYRGERIDLGSVNGVAYYTVEKAGYRVVATLADSDSKPVRMEVVLAPGQTIVLSSQSEAGMAPQRVEIVRRGDRVEVQKLPQTN